MSEHENSPSFKLYAGGHEIEATPRNASLFTFIGKTALSTGLFENSSANHIFLFDEAERDEEAEQMGKYVFITQQTTEQVMGYMAMNGYRCHLNLTQVAECDMDAYQRFAEQLAKSEEVPDTLPEDWK